MAVTHCSRALAFTGLLLVFLSISSCKIVVSKLVIRQYSSKKGIVYPAFPAENLNGNPVVLNDSSRTIKYVHIWATWCSPCIGGIPALNSMTKKLEEYRDVEVVNICVDNPENKEKWKQIVNEHQLLGLNYFVTPDNSFIKELNLAREGLPFFLLVGRDRKILGNSFTPDQGILTMYLLTRARDNYSVEQSFKNFWRQGRRMKRHEDEAARQFVTFLEKYAVDSLKARSED